MELICDGVHIHPSVVRAVFKMFGSKRVILISDTMRAAGMPDGGQAGQCGGSGSKSRRQDVFFRSELVSR